MNTPNPALVTQKAAMRLPRSVLLLCCAAYLLPGLVGRDPWRNADLTAYGYMLAIAEGRASWLQPMLGGMPADGALLPYGLGAAAIAALSPYIDPALAARLPFALLLVATLALVWYTTLRLALTDAAQPLPFAFGGEAAPVDYARALADGALLATLATLGLLQLGHETTPELTQLVGVALYLWALAASGARPWTARLGMALALVVVATSGAPVVALALGLIACALFLRRRDRAARVQAGWAAAWTVLACVLAAVLGAWAWRWSLRWSPVQWLATGRLLLWFLWPAWVLAVWTAWRWRRHLQQEHIAVPLGSAVVALMSCIAQGGSDRALLLAVPGMAVLAAFALPTLKRSTGAAIDWFSVFFFSASALLVWVFFASLHTGWPAKPAANVARLLPGFHPQLNPAGLFAAVMGTLAWLWLVRWRTARHQQALWKSLVLPASGVMLTWLLVMTLVLPMIDYARSPRPLLNRLAPHVPPAERCIWAPALTRAQVAALEAVGHYRVDARSQGGQSCGTLIAPGRRRAPPATPEGWTLVTRVQAPSEREQQLSVYRRAP